MADCAKQIGSLSGNQFNDPRLIKNKLSNAGYKTWLDIEQLKSGDQGVGLFEQLAAAVKEAKIFVPCISDEYAASANCRMEFQFACKTLQKPIVPLIVGSGNNWTETVVGMLIRGHSNIHPIDLRGVTTADELNSTVHQALQAIKGLIGESLPVKTEVKRKTPKIGDHVVCHHMRHCYYMATVVEYNASTMEYTVNWDDGDPSARVQSYDQVCCFT